VPFRDLSDAGHVCACLGDFPVNVRPTAHQGNGEALAAFCAAARRSSGWPIVCGPAMHLAGWPAWAGRLFALRRGGRASWNPLKGYLLDIKKIS
jgi:hypothetical protein